jgi:hypothetical protein
MSAVTVNGKARHLTLMAPNTPLRMEKVQHCIFNPAVYLNRGTLYFLMVTYKHPFTPETGFYNVPEKGYITWIRGFRLIAVSQEHHFPLWDENVGENVTYANKAYLFEAFEGEAPKIIQ